MPTRSLSRRHTRLPGTFLVVALACTACPELPDVLPLLDSGLADGGPGDAASADRLGADGALSDAPGADAPCGPSTPMYGEPCGDCGQYLCDMAGALLCVDPGKNACGVCGELDESAGRLDLPCGSCGVIECTGDGLATQCVGEHAPNACGGCGTIPTIDDGSGGVRDKGPPGAACSSCGSGTWRCAADRDDLVCHRGRGLTSCGGCERCVLYHARMDQRLGGAYLKAGTIALIEDTGTDLDVGSSAVAGTNVSLVFDPLVAGPGASGLALAYVMLSPSASSDDPGSMLLFPEFAASGDGILSDDVRRYSLYSWMALEDYSYVLIYDYFLDTLIAAGELIAGPPVEPTDGGLLDGPPVDSAPIDAALADAGPDAAVPTDASVPDQAPLDAPTEDLQVTDVSIEDAIAVDAAGEDIGPEDRSEDVR